MTEPGSIDPLGGVHVEPTEGSTRPPPPLPPLPGRRATSTRRSTRRATGDLRERLPTSEDDRTDGDGSREESPGADTGVRRTPERRRSSRPSPDDPPPSSTSSTSSWFRLAAGITFALVFAVVLYGTLRPRNADTTAMGLVALPLLIALVYALVRPAARREVRFDLLGIMMFGLALRCIGALARFNAPVDALVYHREGSRIAPALRGLDFGVDTGRSIPGTGWIRYVSGLTHAFVLDDMFVTFVIFTFLSFIGAFLCYRAFAVGAPDGDHRRYALLIFLWPSLVYWPSSIGKEAWMIFGLGIASWGISRIVTGSSGIGLLVTGLGLTTMALVRPHVALMVLLGLGVAMLARPRSRGALRITGRVVIVLILLVGGSIIAGWASEVLQVDLTGSEGITTALEETQEQTDQGGARFSSAIVRSPLDYPEAFVTVWFRPFPFEVSDAAGLLSAAENLVLGALVLVSWRRILGLPRALLRTPYAAYAAAYSLAFVYAFSVIANFGILARQRTQGLVLFFVLLCIPAVTAARAERRSGRERANAELPSRPPLARERPAAASTDPAPDLAPEVATVPRRRRS